MLGLGLSLSLGQHSGGGPNFNYLDNTALRTALAEAALTGLVLAPGALGGEENWLRGARQGPLATGVTGATYTRSGTRAGLGPANLFVENGVRNSVFAGATNGIIGSGGVMPTGFGLSASGLTREIISSANGVLRIRFSGTPSGSVIDLNSTTATIQAAAAGQIWTASRSVRLVAGTLPAASLNTFHTSVHQWTSVPAYVGESTSAATFDGENWVRGVHTSPALSGTTTQVSTILYIFIDNGVPCDFTIEVKEPQLVIGNVPGTYVPNSSTTLSASQVRREAGRGVRVFGSGTNLIYASEAFDDAAWTKNATTVTANTGTAPDGAATADLVTPTVAAGAHNIYQSYTFLAATYTLSVHAKASGYDWIKLGSMFSGNGVYFNVSNGTIGTANGGWVGTIQLLPNGWYRCSVTWTASAGADLPGFYVATADGTNSFTGNGTSGTLAWGIQLEQSAFATDYIPNASTTVSASAGADDLQIAASSLPASGPIVFIADLPAQAFTLVNGRTFEWDNVIGAVFETNAIVTAVPVGATLPSVTGLTNGGARRIVVLHTVGSPTKMSVNGSATVTGTNVGGAIPATTLYLGNRAALDRVLSGSVGVFAAYAPAVTPSDAQLQAMSAL